MNSRTFVWGLCACCLPLFWQPASAHAAEQTGVTFESEYGSEFLFGGGKSERPAAYVVGAAFVVAHYVLKCVGRTADTEPLAEIAAGIGYRHVEFAEMYTVRSESADKFHTVVYDEYCTLGAAHVESLDGNRFDFGVAAVFHAKLYPAASSFKCYAYRVEIGYRVCEVGYELNVEHFSLHGVCGN